MANVDRRKGVRALIPRMVLKLSAAIISIWLLGIGFIYYQTYHSLNIVLSAQEHGRVMRDLTMTEFQTIVLVILLIWIVSKYHFSIAYSQLNEYEANLLDAAHTDPLTNLPNRLVLDSALLTSMKNSVVNGSPFAVAFVDLDGFKEINDSLGHHSGDELVIQVSKRFKRLLRDNDIVIRQGGDEFVLILNEIHHKDIANLMNRIIKNINEPYQIDDVTVSVGCSIGISEYQVTQSTPKNLISQADKAMYHAKRSGKNQVVFYRDIADAT